MYRIMRGTSQWNNLLHPLLRTRTMCALAGGDSARMDLHPRSILAGIAVALVLTLLIICFEYVVFAIDSEFCFQHSFPSL